MIKIMLSAVGNHDPYGLSQDQQTDGPILTAVKDLLPDILFLFPTTRQPDPRYNSTEENGEKVKEVLNGLFRKLAVYARPLNLPDPTDHKEIILQLGAQIDSIKKSYEKSQVEYQVAVSSGTPQIYASFLALINSNRLRAKAYQVINPLFTKPDEPRVRLVETQFLEEENQIARARRFFEALSFNDCSAELAALGAYTCYPERSKKAEIFVDLVDGYYHWDLYQHSQALEKLDRVLNEINRFNFKDLSAIITAQIDTVRKIIALGDREDYLNLVDLYHNAKRRHECHQYIDCLNRFKRLYEGSYYYVAREKLGISPNKKIEQQPEKVHEIIPARSGFLGTRDISTLHQALIGTELVSSTLESQLDGISLQRNTTINNHGMKSVDGDDSRKAIQCISKLFEKIFQRKDIEDYCFSLGRIKDVGKIMFDTL
jgi:hypothetical protein